MTQPQTDSRAQDMVNKFIPELIRHSTYPKPLGEYLTSYLTEKKGATWAIAARHAEGQNPEHWEVLSIEPSGLTAVDLLPLFSTFENRSGLQVWRNLKSAEALNLPGALACQAGFGEPLVDQGHLQGMILAGFSNLRSLDAALEWVSATGAGIAAAFALATEVHASPPNDSSSREPGSKIGSASPAMNWSSLLIQVKDFLIARDVHQAYEGLLRLFLELSGSSSGLVATLAGGHVKLLERIGPDFSPQILGPAEEEEIGTFLHTISKNWKAEKDPQTFNRESSPPSPLPSLIHRGLILPVMFDEKLVGLILLVNKPDEYSMEMTQTCGIFVRQIAPILYARHEIDEQTKLRQQTEEQLHASEEKMRGLYNSAAFRMGIFGLEKDDYIYLLPNETMAKTYGMTVAQLSGKSAREIGLREDLRRFWLRTFRKALRKPGGLTIEYRHTWAGRDYWYLGTVSHIHGSPADCPQFSLVTVDITDRKIAEMQLQKSEEKYRSIIETAEEGILTIDQKGFLTFFNDKFAHLLQYEAEEIAGSSIFCYIPPDWHAFFEQQISQRKAGKRGSYEIKLLRKDGSQIWTSISASPMLDDRGKYTGSLAMITDITYRKQVEEQLIENQYRLNKAQEMGSVGSWEGILGSDQIWTSKVGRQIFGLDPNREIYSTEEIESKIPEREMTHQAYLDLVHLHKKYDLEFVVLPGDGGPPRIVASKAELIRDEQGRPFKVSGMIQDITERRTVEKNLLDSEKRFRKAIMVAPIPIMIHAEGNEIIAVNDAWREITGYPPSAFKSMDSWLKLAHGSEEHIHRANINHIYSMDEKTYGDEVEITTAAGEKRIWYMISTQLGRTTDYRSMVITMAMDITEQKKAELEVKQLTDELEQRVADRTRELEEANRDLESFSYSVSHDLRAPLRAIDGFSRILVEEYGVQLPEEGQRYVKIIRENTQKMGQLVDDLLAFSRLGRQALKKRIIDPTVIVQEVLEDLAAEQKDRVLDIRIDRLPPCNADPALLRHVYQNLLSNALKFTRKVPRAVIEVGFLSDSGSNPEQEGSPDQPVAGAYYVRDNGVGFDMQYANKLFQVFQRLHRIEDYEGTGVGLAIVQRIIQRHGGRIWAQAGINQGATFYFTLEGGSKNE